MAFDNSLANFHNRNVPIQFEEYVPNDVFIEAHLKKENRGTCN